MNKETIVVAGDHVGVALRRDIAMWLTKRGIVSYDVGPEEGLEADYPDYAARLAEELRVGRARRGILVCGTGIGMSIAANRFPFLRAALVFNTTYTALARRHNDANVLCVGARTMEPVEIFACIEIFLSTDFEGKRHMARVEKLGRLP